MPPKGYSAADKLNLYIEQRHLICALDQAHMAQESCLRAVLELNSCVKQGRPYSLVCELCQRARLLFQHT